MAAGRLRNPKMRVSARLLLAAILSTLVVFVTTPPVFASSYETAVSSTTGLQAFWTLDGTTSEFLSGHPLTQMAGAAFCVPLGGAPWGSSTTQVFCPDGSGYLTFGPGLVTQANTSLEFSYKSTATTPLQYLFSASGACGGNNEAQVNAGDFTPGYDGCGPDGFHYHIPDSNWHLYDVVWLTTGIQTWVDGTLIATQAGSFPYTGYIPGGGGGAIGARVGCGSCPDRIMPLHSYIGEVSAYSIALGSSAITSHYTAWTVPPATPNTMTMDPNSFSLVKGQHILTTLNSYDSAGSSMTSGDSFSYVGATADGSTVLVPGVMTCALQIGYTNKFVCSGDTQGSYSIQFADTHGLSVSGHVVISGPVQSFAILPSEASFFAGGNVTFRNSSTDAAGNDVSRSDGWNFQTPLPVGVTCNPAVNEPATIAITCFSDTTGAYVLTAVDSFGIPALVNLKVAGAGNASSVTCASDPLGGTICWLSQVWKAVSRIPADLVAGFYNMLFVSSSGRSFVDLRPITANLWPQMNCRSGQSPTASDGIHCYSFPFSVPSDVGSMLGLVNQTPSAPTISVAWDFPLWTGTVLHEAATVDPRVLLTDTTMTYVRDIELFLFIIGCAFGTWRLLQLVGVG